MKKPKFSDEEFVYVYGTTGQFLGGGTIMHAQSNFEGAWHYRIRGRRGLIAEHRVRKVSLELMSRSGS